ncbi:MAG: hypothetical protein MRY64_16995 [Hyphomonadaceae bacterium]|nr:hypothetical protein [Hyphomonadaceae bacterium]
MARFTALFLAASLFVGVAIYGLAKSQGLDLLDSQVRTIAGFAAITALYAGLRIAMVLNKLLAPRDEDEARETSQPKKKSAFARWGRSSSLDARLAARQARLDAARARLEAGEHGPDSGETS